MIWDFLKKRWFSVALALLLVVAVARKNLRINVGGSATPAKKEQREKYTTQPAVAQSPPALMSIGSDAASAPARMPAVDDATAMAFLKRFREVARGEQQKFGMPASVLLACAYVNSFAGQRDCAGQANNFLALRCTAEWSGPVATCSGACFRKYNTAWESIRDFNLYLSKRDWYASLKKKAKQPDWRAWVKALREHHVSDVENFEGEMAKVIQQYQLFELD